MRAGRRCFLVRLGCLMMFDVYNSQDSFGDLVSYV